MSYYQTMADLYRRLAKDGFDRKFVTRTVLPENWQDSFANEPAGRAEAEAHLTKALGLSPNAFLDPSASLTWPGEENTVQWSSPPSREPHEYAMLKLGRRLASLVHQCHASPLENWIASATIEEIRNIVIEQHRSLTLQTLSTTCWSLGLPVLCIVNPPGKRSYVDGMLLGPVNSPVIVLSSNDDAPGWVLWQLAYLIGHLNAGHLKRGDIVLTDLLAGDSTEARIEVDQRACALVHGNDSVRLAAHDRVTGVKLAQAAAEYSRSIRTDVGAVITGFAIQKSLNGVNAKGPANKALKVLGIQGGARSTVGRIALPRLNNSRLAPAERRFLTALTQGV